MPVQDLQFILQNAVIANLISGVLLLLEHEPVITLGNRGNFDDVQKNLHVKTAPILPVVHAKRGGQTTLHAPGQLICYPIVPIAHHNLRKYIYNLEETVLVLLANLGITANRRIGQPGVFVDNSKISSLGLRCRRWVASHGLSLNVNVDLTLFEQIIPCGDPQMRQTSLEALSITKLTANTKLTIEGERHESTNEQEDFFSMSDIKKFYLQAAEEVFGWPLETMRQAPYHEVKNILGIR